MSCSVFFFFFFLFFFFVFFLLLLLFFFHETRNLNDVSVCRRQTSLWAHTTGVECQGAYLKVIILTYADIIVPLNRF